MAIISKIISVMVSVIMAILNLFGLGGEEPGIELGEIVNTNAAQVLEIYNAAVIKTDEDAPLVESKMHIDNISVGDMTFPENLFSDTVYEDYDIPGEGLLTADDVVSAKSSTENGKTTVIIEVKEQTDSFNADAYIAGPVSRAMGTLGDMESALELLEAEVLSGEDTIELAYTNCTIACVIDDATGEIIRGEWNYDVCFTVECAEFLIFDTVMVFEDMDADFSYTIVL